MTEQTKQIKPHQVACDDGFAEIKVAYLNGGELVQRSFPSTVAVGGELVRDLNGKKDNTTYSTGLTDFTVSPFISTESTQFESYPTSELNRVLVHHALRECGFGGKHIELSTSLPPGSYYRRQGVNKKLIDRKRKNLWGKIYGADGMPTAKIDNHWVTSEAVAAAFDYFMDFEGNQIKELNDPMAVVDIGGRTTDCLLVLPPGSQIDSSQSGTSHIGVLDVRELVSEGITDTFDIAEPNRKLIDTALANKTIKVMGVEQDVTEIVDFAINQVATKMDAFIKSKITSIKQVDKVLFVGGGASVMRSVLQKFPNAVVPEDPQFANARGMLKFLIAREMA